MTQELGRFNRLKQYCNKLPIYYHHIRFTHFRCNCNCNGILPSYELLTEFSDEVFDFEEVMWLGFWYDPEYPKRKFFDNIMRHVILFNHVIIQSLINHFQCEFCVDFINESVILFANVMHSHDKK